LHCRILRRHLHGDVVQRQAAPLRLLCVGRLRPSLARSARFRRGVTGLLDLELIVEHRLGKRRRRGEPGQFEQRAVGAGELRLHKTARIGGGVDEVTGSAAARAKTEAIEGNERGLRIAGHPVSLRSA